MRIKAKKIIEKMSEKLMTQKALAEVSGVSRITINNTIHKSSCSIPTVAKIAKALGVDPAELIEKEV